MPRPHSIPIDTVARLLGHIDAVLRAPAVEPALAALTRALLELAGDSSVYFGLYRRDAPPVVLGLEARDEWNRSYPDGHYLLDPCYEAFQRMDRSTCLLPQEVFPKAFRSSEFYLSYYRPMGMVDEICYLVRLDADIAAYVSLMRLGASRPFTRAEGGLLRMALPAVETAMRHVHALYARQLQSAEEPARALHRHLSAALDDFGRDALSEREFEVTRLLLKGLAPKVVGRMLDIAPGTVRNHIKSIYWKLGVRSQAELLAAFFEALASRANPPQ